MPEEMTYVDAVNLALHHALEEDSSVIVFGEDVAIPGGVFGATRGLRDTYGDRVFDTPISESAILGAALGSSIMGMRPVAEIMWIDFSLVAVDQLVNQAANVRYVSEGRLTAPMTVRTQQGVLPGSCAQHSQSLEALYAHIPGLIVGTPATPGDAYHMLRHAIAADDPTLVIENRGLYRAIKEEVDPTAAPAGIGSARVVREGDDLTLVSWSSMVHQALSAAESLAEELSVEVIDLRWISPWDKDTVVESVEKTGRLVVAHEANMQGGFGAEIAAYVADEAWSSLKAAPRRVGLPNLRIPAAPHLQAAVVPDAAAIARAALEAARR